MTQSKKYGGVVVPMVTPFTESHQLDTIGITNLVEHLVGSGAHPFVAGTTGESASISRAEKLAL